MLAEKEDMICSEEDFITGLGAKIIETGESECIEKIYPIDRGYRIISQILSCCLTVCMIATCILGTAAFSLGAVTAFYIYAGWFSKIPEFVLKISLYGSWVMVASDILLLISILPRIATKTGKKKTYTCIGDKNVLDELGKSFECVNVKGPNCKVFRSKTVTDEMDDEPILLMMPFSVAVWLWTAYCYDIFGLQNLGTKAIVPVGIVGVVLAKTLVNRYRQWCSQMVEKRGEE